MIKKLVSKLHKSSKTELAKGKSKGQKRLSVAPRLKTFSSDYDSPRSHHDFETDRARLELYRFLRDNIPILSSVIWTWVRLCASRYEYRFAADTPVTTEERARKVLDQLDKRIYQNGLIKQGGFRELLIQFFESLFTDGAVCGELQLIPSRRSVARFAFADMKTISLEQNSVRPSIYQICDDRKTRLDENTIFYYGLGSSPESIKGRSLLQSIPFVARVEQTLVHDMHRAMRNSGYHRIHVKITPPEQRADESDDDYLARANSYFDDTMGMMKDFGPDKNPVTWDDVKIEYIGSSSRISASNAWYVNHKAMIEDICAGTHLAPFMLGYAYGTTHNWAEFKYELVARQVETVQNAAASLLDWLANIELALSGIDATVSYHFHNSVTIGRQERANVEKTQIENIITKLNSDLITREQAQRELEHI